MEREGRRNGGHPGLEEAFLCLVVYLEIALHRRQQADHLLLADLHAPANAAPGAPAPSGGQHQVLAAQQQAGTLGPQQSLAPAESHQVESHPDILRKPPLGGHVGGGVVESGNPMLLSHGNPGPPIDLALGVEGVDKEEHGGRGIDGGFQLGGGFDFHDPGAHQLDLGFVGFPV